MAKALAVASSGKGKWLAGGLLVLLLLWWLARRGSGSSATVIPGAQPSDASIQAAGQGFGALAAAVAQMEQARLEAAAYINGQNTQAGAQIAAADRYASAQENAYVWSTIRDIGVTAIPYVFGTHSTAPASVPQSYGNPNGGGYGGFGGGVNI